MPAIPNWMTAARELQAGAQIEILKSMTSQREDATTKVRSLPKSWSFKIKLSMSLKSLKKEGKVLPPIIPLPSSLKDFNYQMRRNLLILLRRKMMSKRVLVPSIRARSKISRTTLREPTAILIMMTASHLKRFSLVSIKMIINLLKALPKRTEYPWTQINKILLVSIWTHLKLEMFMNSNLVKRSLARTKDMTINHLVMKKLKESTIRSLITIIREMIMKNILREARRNMTINSKCRIFITKSMSMKIMREDLFKLNLSLSNISNSNNSNNMKMKSLNNKLKLFPKFLKKMLLWKTPLNYHTEKKFKIRK